MAIAPDDASPDPFDVLVTVAREAVWSGPLTETVLVRTWENEAICGYSFEIGHDYLIYASGGPIASTILCDRTHERWAGDPDIVALGPPLVSVGVQPRSWSAAKIPYR